MEKQSFLLLLGVAEFPGPEQIGWLDTKERGAAANGFQVLRADASGLQTQ
jgi:hypothetical protein